MFEKYEKINSLNLFDFHTLAAIYMNNAFNECWNLSSLNGEFQYYICGRYTIYILSMRKIQLIIFRQF